MGSDLEFTQPNSVPPTTYASRSSSSKASSPTRLRHEGLNKNDHSKNVSHTHTESPSSHPASSSSNHFSNSTQNPTLNQSKANPQTLVSQSSTSLKNPMSFPITIDISVKESTRRPSLLSIGNDSSSFKGPTFHLDTFSQKGTKEPEVKDPTLPHDPDTESDSDLDFKRYSLVSTPSSEHSPSESLPSSSLMTSMSQKSSTSIYPRPSPLFQSQPTLKYETNAPIKTRPMQLPASHVPNPTNPSIPSLPNSKSDVIPTTFQANVPFNLLPKPASHPNPPVQKEISYFSSSLKPFPPPSKSIPPTPPIPSRPPPLSVLMEGEKNVDNDENDSDDDMEYGEDDEEDEEDDEDADDEAEGEEEFYLLPPSTLTTQEYSETSFLEKHENPPHLSYPPPSRKMAVATESTIPFTSIRLRPSLPLVSMPSSSSQVSELKSTSSTTSSGTSSTRTFNTSSTFTPKSITQDTGYVLSSQEGMPPSKLKKYTLPPSVPLTYEAMDSDDLADLDGLVQELDKLLETGKASKRLSHLVAPKLPQFPKSSSTSHLATTPNNTLPLTHGSHQSPSLSSSSIEKHAQAIGLNAKDPNVLLALEKLAKAQIQKVATRIYIHDASSFRTVYLTPFMTADMVVSLILGKDRRNSSMTTNAMSSSSIAPSDFKDKSKVPSTHTTPHSLMTSSPKGEWALFELFNDMHLERPLKEWELVMQVLKSWEPMTKNVLILRKYNYSQSLSVDALKQYYPPIQGSLYLETKKGSFKKSFFELNPDKYAVYIRKKNSQPFELLCTLFEMDIYTSIAHKKKQPTPYSFAIKSMARKSMFEDAQLGYVYYFCADSVEHMKEWVLALRNIKGHADEIAHPEWFDEDGAVVKRNLLPTSLLPSNTLIPAKPLLQFEDSSIKPKAPPLSSASSSSSSSSTRPFINDPLKSKMGGSTFVSSNPLTSKGGGGGGAGEGGGGGTLLKLDAPTSPNYADTKAGKGMGGKGTLMDQIDQKKGSQKSTNEQYHSTHAGTKKRNLIDFIPDST
ncbi:hypothetical protein HMI56_002112 [Coelomomyces lativittatus]|nr:hypothetical protein HMI56_002112 [Coelomomyces lativittatus]